MIVQLDISKPHLKEIDKMAEEYGDRNKAMQHILDTFFIKNMDYIELTQQIQFLAQQMAELKTEKKVKVIRNVKGEVIRMKEVD